MPHPVADYPGQTVRISMSFLSVLKDIGKGAEKVLAIAAPVAAAAASFVPGGSIFGTLLSAVVTAEQLITTPGSGAEKKAIVLTILKAVHPGLDEATADKAIDGIVAVLNTLATSIEAQPSKPVN
jgi:hypothetical protein